MLGSFKPKESLPTTKVEKPNQVISAKGTIEQRNQIFELLKGKPQTSREIVNATGLAPQQVFNIMHFLYGSGQVERIQNPNSKYREFIFSLPPSKIEVV